jgi:hypothetical protein
VQPALSPRSVHETEHTGTSIHEYYMQVSYIIIVQGLQVTRGFSTACRRDISSLGVIFSSSPPSSDEGKYEI